MVRFCRPIIWHFKTTSRFLRPRNMLWIWNFPKYISLAKEVDWWRHFWFQNRFLVSKLHISHGNQSMTSPIVITLQGVNDSKYTNLVWASVAVEDYIGWGEMRGYWQKAPLRVFEAKISPLYLVLNLIFRTFYRLWLALSEFWPNSLPCESSIRFLTV